MGPSTTSGGFKTVTFSLGPERHAATDARRAATVIARRALMIPSQPADASAQITETEALGILFEDRERRLATHGVLATARFLVVAIHVNVLVVRALIHPERVAVIVFAVGCSRGGRRKAAAGSCADEGGYAQRCGAPDWVVCLCHRIHLTPRTRQASPCWRAGLNM